RELDAFEAELRKKLIATKAKRSQGKPYTKADLRLELKLSNQRIFSDAEKALHQDLLEAANRTQDPEEKAALDACEAPMLEKLRMAYTSGNADTALGFEAPTARDV